VLTEILYDKLSFRTALHKWGRRHTARQKF